MHNRKQSEDGKIIRPFLLYDGRREALGKALEPFGEPIALPPYRKLPAPLCAHPDLLIFVKENVLYTYGEYYEEQKALFDSLGRTVRKLTLPCGGYPDDIWLDCLPYGEYILGKKERIPKELANGFRPLYVKQGYARCGTLVYKDFAVTADKGIASALRSVGAKVLQIAPGNILLDGYESGGFIGGAAAVVGENVLFFGSLSYHPNGKEIGEFLLFAGAKVIELFDAPLTDVGSAAVLK